MNLAIDNHGDHEPGAVPSRHPAVEDIVSWAAIKLHDKWDEMSHSPSAELPWRQWRTPYRQFLAEFLLVRTRTDVVARLFESIAAHYPNPAALADADEGELGVILEPLGMRKRVPLLLKAARYLVEHHCGHVPERIEELLAVPGLGPYTAVAIVAFVHDVADVPADVNILRFLSRLTGLPMVHPTKGSAELRALLPLLSSDKGGPKQERLLDFSRLICRPGRPRCEQCPLTQKCRYFTSVVRESAAP